MHPVLFRFPEFIPLIGGKGIHSYGVMIAFAFFCGLIWVKYESKRLNMDQEKIMDLFFYVAISGLVGSRLFYIFHSVSNFWSDPLVLFRVWEGGLVFQGGVILALIVSVLYMRKNDMPVFKTADIFVPALAMGHGLGRGGCFFAGCCHGAQCSPDYLMAITFPENPDSVALQGIPLYPTQLWEAGAEFILFGVLVWYRNRKAFDGALLLSYLIIYSFIRSILELYRGDTIRGDDLLGIQWSFDGRMIGISNGQLIAAITIAVSLFVWAYLKNKAKENS